MKEKKILPYLSARIVKGRDRWYILYYQSDPETSKLKRFRPTYDLNRIRDITERTRVGEGLVKKINDLLPTGWPFLESDDPRNQNILEALVWMERMKYSGLAAESIRKYQRFVTLLRVFLKQEGKEQIKISQFSALDAYEAMQYIWDNSKISNNTYNRFLRDAIILFNLLKDYKFIEDNPFKAVKKKRPKPKTRRNFTEAEKLAVAAYLKEKDYYLFLAVLLQHGCFIRPGELNKLLFSYFDLKAGVITLPGEITKNGKIRHVTIPDIYIKYFRNPKFAGFHVNWYVFGEGLVPGPEAIYPDRMRKRHKKHLDKMLELGLLENLVGLQWYSWKDTGITDALTSVGVEYVRQQADHSKYETTLRYNHASMVNLGMKGFAVSLVA